MIYWFIVEGNDCSESGFNSAAYVWLADGLVKVDFVRSFKRCAKKNHATAKFFKLASPVVSDRFQVLESFLPVVYMNE